MRKTFSVLLFILTAGMWLNASAQDKVDQIVNTGTSRSDAAQASQQRVDKIATEADKIFANYKRELKVVEGLKVYNALLQRQLDDQQREMQTLRKSIQEVAIIERQITPLMLRMTDALEQFIELDMPFLLDERRERVARLRDTIGRADVSVAEKFRTVLEAYQIENDYGRTIESYEDVMEVAGQSRGVSLLKFGRVSLVYQTEGGEYNAVWDQANREWKALDAAEYRNHIAKGLKIARKQVAPDIIILPVGAAEGGQ